MQTTFQSQFEEFTAVQEVRLHCGLFSSFYNKRDGGFQNGPIWIEHFEL